MEEDTMKTCDVMAFDLGASSGRGMLAEFDGNKLTLREINRFPHSFSLLGDLAYWDILMLMDSIKQGLRMCKSPLVSAGIDTWGVDFGLLDRNGSLVSMPRSYRDEAYNDENMREALDFLGGEEWLFRQTYVASINYNPVFKLYHMKKMNESALAAADTLLMMPNLMEYFLTGVKHSEYSVVSTSQLYNMKDRCWAGPVLDKLGIGEDLFTPVDIAGKVLGKLSGRIMEETGQRELDVISVAGHDTASAIAAVPSPHPEYTFLSSGTWSLMGIASNTLLEGGEIVRDKIANEGTWDGGYRPTVNISGLWILQECRKQWRREGRGYSFDDLTDKARRAKPLQSFIRPDEFIKKGNYPQMIREFCKSTGQPVPESAGEMVRCILESLALKYKQVYRRIRGYITWPESIYIVGGGVRNQLLNQFTADALGIPVITGPAESTAVGNILVQLETLGELSGYGQRCQVIADSFEQQEYLPRETARWEDAFDRFCRLYEGRDR